MTPVSFSAFVERCEQRVIHKRQAAGLEPMRDGTHGRDAEILAEAARHARLLERIEQWAHSAVRYDGDTRFTGGQDHAKAEVLRLLRDAEK